MVFLNGLSGSETYVFRNDETHFNDAEILSSWTPCVWTVNMVNELYSSMEKSNGVVRWRTPITVKYPKIKTDLLTDARIENC
jgi:hypothetical protein